MAGLKLQLKGALKALLVVALLLIGLWVGAGIHLGIWTFTQYERHILLREEVPVDGLLWRWKIRAGDNVDDLVKVWRPDMIQRFGPWVNMEWYPGGLSPDGFTFIGVSIIAKNGVLVSAVSFSDDRLNNKVFFDTESPGDKVDFHTALKTYVTSLNTGTGK